MPGEDVRPPSIFGSRQRANADSGAVQPMFRLGELLVRAGHLSDETLEKALSIQRAAPEGKPLGSLLVDLGLCSEEAVAQALALQLGVTYLSQAELSATLEDVEALGVDICRNREILPLRSSEGEIVLAMSDPFCTELANLAEQVLGQSVSPAAATRSAIMGRLATLTGLRDPFEEALEQSLSETPSDPDHGQAGAFSHGFVRPVVNEIVARAIDEHATAIFITPRSSGVAVEFRILGALREAFHLPKGIHGPLLKHLTSQAKSTAVGGHAQLTIASHGRSVDFEMIVVPSEHGDKLVLQAKQEEELAPRLDSIGLLDEQLEVIRNVLAERRGCVIVAGPPNSGVTTTLYAALGLLAEDNLNIVTIEKSTERPLSGVSRVEIPHEPGRTTFFALRALLSRHPDVIMVGDIRDRTAADMALRAGITGALVLAGLHATSAAQVILRLRELGVEDRLIASGVELIVAQRLAGRLCRECLTDRKPDSGEALLLEQVFPGGAARVPTAHGCEHCGGVGHEGHIALAEVMQLSGPVRSVILDGGSADEIDAAARQSGMAPMFKVGVQRALAGEVDLRDVVRNAPLPVKAKDIARVATEGGDEAGRPVQRRLGPLPGQAVFDSSDEPDSQRFEDFCRTLDDLPTIPESIARLQAMLTDPGADSASVSRIIETDPVITARIMRAANSAMFSLRRDIVTVRDAVALLGFVQVWNLAIATHLIDAFKPEGALPMPLNALWVHSLATSVCANALSRASSRVRRVDLATMAGLLHDIGKVVLALYNPEPFGACIEVAQAAKVPLWQVERDRLGFTHAHVAEWLLSEWRLPREIGLAVRHHHSANDTPDDAPEGTSALAKIVCLADDAIKSVGIGESGDNTAISWSISELQGIGLSPAGVARAVSGSVRAVPGILDLLRKGE